MREIQDVLTNGSAPKGPQTDHLRDVIDSFQNYEPAYSATVGSYGYTASRDRATLQANFEAWGHSYIQQHPDVSDAWNLLIALEG